MVLTGKMKSELKTECWICGELMMEKVACELVCENCGLIRDCSDP